MSVGQMVLVDKDLRELMEFSSLRLQTDHTDARVLGGAGVKGLRPLVWGASKDVLGDW